MKKVLYAIWEHIEYLFAVLLFAGVFCLAITSGSFADPNVHGANYVNKIFDTSYVHQIDVSIDDKDYEDLLSEPREKIKYHTTVTIDGEVVNDVAFSVRGNGSLGYVASTPGLDRYSFTLNFGKFNKDNSYHGLDKLILNGLVQDPSGMKEYLSSMLITASGIDAPLVSFAQLYINGELKGLYATIEGVDRSYLTRTGAEKTAALFHPIPYSFDQDRIYKDQKSLPEGESLMIEERKNNFGGADLIYKGDDVEHYDAIFENASTKYSTEDVKLIINAIKSIDPLELELSPEDYWDIDAVINFFVAAELAPNTDSYLGDTSQNYYLKLNNGKISVIPWDHDRAFHAAKLDEDTPPEESAILWPIDSPLYYDIALEQRPLWLLISSNESYMKKYHDKLQKVIDEFILTGECEQRYNAAVELIRPYVYSDPSWNYDTGEFEHEAGYIGEFITLRADSIQKQLWGIYPITRELMKQEKE